MSEKKKDKYEYVTCEEIALFNQKMIGEQAKSIYSSQGKQLKTKWKQLKSKETTNKNSLRTIRKNN